MSCITTEDGPETGVVIRTEREDEEEAFKSSELGRRGEAVAASSSRLMSIGGNNSWSIGSMNWARILSERLRFSIGVEALCWIGLFVISSSAFPKL